MLFLHIRLHMTGTTFLQKAVFPYWKDITYLPHDKLEDISRLARLFSGARIILSFRRHSSYIASSYLQRGGYLLFGSEPFVKLHEDSVVNLRKMLCDSEVFMGGKVSPLNKIKPSMGVALKC